MKPQFKLFEIRDEGTMIPWMAFKIGEAESFDARILTRAGYGQFPWQSDCVIQGPAHCDGVEGAALAYKFEHVRHPRTQVAAYYIHEKFDELVSGQVIDIRVLLGERGTAAAPEHGFLLVAHEIHMREFSEHLAPWVKEERGSWRRPKSE